MMPTPCQTAPLSSEFEKSLSGEHLQTRASQSVVISSPQVALSGIASRSYAVPIKIPPGATPCSLTFVGQSNKTSPHHSDMNNSIKSSPHLHAFAPRSTPPSTSSPPPSDSTSHGDVCNKISNETCLKDRSQKSQAQPSVQPHASGSNNIISPSEKQPLNQQRSLSVSTECSSSKTFPSSPTLQTIDNSGTETVISNLEAENLTQQSIQQVGPANPFSPMEQNVSTLSVPELSNALNDAETNVDKISDTTCAPDWNSTVGPPSTFLNAGAGDTENIVVKSQKDALSSPTARNQGDKFQESTPKSTSSYGSRMAAVRANVAAIEDVPNSVIRDSLNCGDEENRPPLPASSRFYYQSVSQGRHAASRNADDSRGTANLVEEIRELERMHESVAKVRAASTDSRARPLICQDITNSNADTIRISHLPRGITYDRVCNLVESFGEVEEIVWTAVEPHMCDVVYREASAAQEACNVLNDAYVPDGAEKALKVDLRPRDSGAQLFVGDLTPDVTEQMLEETFSEIVGEPVKAVLKRDPDSLSPIGYGFLSFQNESSANFALVAGHRAKIGNACVRVGRAERNTYLYVSDLAGNVDMTELKNVFGKFGTLVEEDTVIIRRSFAFIRYKSRGAAENAKRTLEKTDLKGHTSVRYAEAEPLKACVSVQFHSSVPRPPNSLRELLLATFGKHGNCSVEIPRLHNGLWRRVAFVTFHGEPIAANLAALEAVQSIKFVSSLPVCCQFARELIPRLPTKGLTGEKVNGIRIDHADGNSSIGFVNQGHQGRLISRTLGMRPNNNRPVNGNFENVRNEAKGDKHKNSAGVNNFGGERFRTSSKQTPNFPGNERCGSAGHMLHGQNEYVPVYVPISALHQHPSGVMAGGLGVGNTGVAVSLSMASTSSSRDTELPGYSGWPAAPLMVGNAGGAGGPTVINQTVPGTNMSLGSLVPGMQDHLRW